MKIRLFFIGMMAALSLRADLAPAEKIYGSGFIAAVRRADAIDAQRVSVEFPPGEGNVRAVKVTPKGGGIRLSGESQALLKRAFLKESEEYQAAKLCMPLPGVRYVFRSSSASASVLVCYKCRIALIEQDGQVIREAYVDHVIGELRKVAESFMSAEEVAKLP